MPAPHISSWDRLAQSLDPHALTQRDLASLNARHALPRLKKHPLYSTLRSWSIPALVILAVLTFAFGEKLGITLDQALQGLRYLIPVLVGVIAFQVVMTFIDQSPALIRRRRREALIHPRPRRTATRHTERPTADALVLAELIGRRRDYWLGRLRAFRPWDWYGFASSSIWWVATFPLLAFLPQLIATSNIFAPRSQLRFLQTALPCMVLALIVASILGRRRLNRLSQSLIHRVCPDCGYSLDDAPDATLPHAGQVLGLGPRRCTECGVPWPLLPPPKPASKS